MSNKLFLFRTIKNSLYYIIVLIWKMGLYGEHPYTKCCKKDGKYGETGKKSII